MSNDGFINVCLATDRNYLQYAGVVVASILKHAAPDDKLKFYILEDGLIDEDRKVLRGLAGNNICEYEFVTPDWAALPEGRLIKYISRASLLRLQLPELLPEVDKIIYLDCDVIVTDSLAELWNIDMTGALVAGSADYCGGLDKHKESIGCDHVYLNSGSLMMNLKLGREVGISQKFLKVGEELGEKATLLDQDIINVAVGEKRLVVPLKWNLSTGYYKRCYKEQHYSNEEIVEAAKHPAIIHFSGKKKPWVWKRCRHNLWFEYYRALKDTPWHGQYWTGLLKKLILPHRRGKGPASGIR